MVVDQIPCYIRNNNTGASITFTAQLPETVNDAYVANFGEQATMGRSSPFKTYSHSGPRSVTFSVELSLDYNRDLVQQVDVMREMLRPYEAEWIVPPSVNVRIGEFINIKAVPLSFEAIWSGGYIDSTYRICEVVFSFDEVEDACVFSSNTGEFKGSEASGSGGASNGAETGSGNANVDDGRVQEPPSNEPVEETYEVKKLTYGYKTAAEAERRQATQKVNVIEPGTYYIVMRQRNVINISKVKTTAGSWVYPE